MIWLIPRANNMTKILYMFLLAPERANKLGEPLGRVSHVCPARSKFSQIPY